MPLYVARPSGTGRWPGVVVIHDALGMSRDILNQADWLAGEGFFAVAPDLFYWGRRSTCLFALLRGWLPYSDLDAARNWLAGHENCTDRIGVIGFCMGGGFALALASDHDFAVASVNYGGPTKEVAQALSRACPIVGSFGARDRWPGMRSAPDRIEKILSSAEIDHDIKRYPDAGHGFMNDHRSEDLAITDKVIAKLVAASYDESSNLDARRRIVAFFCKHLR